MGRNRVTIDEDHYIVFGFDAPCNGYFAEYYDKTSEEYKLADNASDIIGFFMGVNKNAILDFLEKYNCIKLAKEQKETAFNNLILDLPC